MIPMVSVFDALSALMILWHSAYVCIISKGVLNRYLIVPNVLAWVHVVGNFLQETHRGPEWIIYHLHDLGVATIIMHGVFFIIVFGGSRHKSDLTKIPYTIDMTLKLMLPAYVIATLLCCYYKVIQVTVFREESIAQGYSGQLDLGDLIALLIGCLIMVINHYAMRGSVLRRKDQILKKLEPR